MNKNTTCGPMFRVVFNRAMRLNNMFDNWNLGYLCCGAEKVWLGACPAVMLRPSRDYYKPVERNIRFIAKHYQLKWLIMDTSAGREYWLYSPASCGLMTMLEELLANGQENTSTWHTVRGMLCGVPLSQIDHKFHDREGYGKQADLIDTSLVIKKCYK